MSNFQETIAAPLLACAHNMISNIWDTTIYHLQVSHGKEKRVYKGVKTMAGGGEDGRSELI